MKRLLYFLVFVLMPVCGLQAQQSEFEFYQFLSASGMGDLPSDISYSWALGDVFTDADHMGSQILIISSQESPEPALLEELGIRLNGNPTRTAVVLELDQPMRLSWQLVDLHGRMMAAEVIPPFAYRRRIDMQKFPPATYFLLIRNIEGRLLGTFKLVKQ